jgi:hypothetical protein
LIEKNNEILTPIQSIKDKELYILEILNHYKHRSFIVEMILYNLDNCISVLGEPRTDLIDLVVLLMQKHSKQVRIQMGRMVCLVNLIEDRLGEQIGIKYLDKIVKGTNRYAVIPESSNNTKNALLTLRIECMIKLHNISFDKFERIQLIMESMVAFKYADVNEVAVEIC